MTAIDLAPVPDLDALAASWQGLEARADVSFFQSWTWTGCLATERFDDPVLLSAIGPDGAPLALGLFNRRRGRLWLGESGRSDIDSVFIEHNGLVLDRAAPQGLVDGCLRVLRRHRVVLSGADVRHLAAMRALPGAVRRRATREAPCVDRTTLPSGPYLASLSANTRYQIRRSDRSYAARGPLHIRRAASEAEAHAFLAALAVLHQRYWESRGRPGAFAVPAFARFHHALIARGWPAGEVDLLRITAGDAIIGFLYNFVHRGEVSAYQSGFDYAAAGPHEKPGLTCHRLAIELYRGEGMRRYDFLAGDDRYKTSLANGSRALHWFDYAPRYSAGWAAARLRAALRH
jgi:CelD/BcsL family acetyltransferase involved in cellulose biosynthesis